jgi:hypothetical protein
MSNARVIREFATVLNLLSRGRFVEKIDEKLAEAMTALNAHPDDKAKASVTLTFEFTRVQERVGIKPSIKLKLPEEKGFAETVMFAVEDGLSLQHPSQIDMFSGPRGVDPNPRAAPAGA